MKTVREQTPSTENFTIPSPPPPSSLVSTATLLSYSYQFSLEIRKKKKIVNARIRKTVLFCNPNTISTICSNTSLFYTDALLLHMRFCCFFFTHYSVSNSNFQVFTLLVLTYYSTEFAWNHFSFIIPGYGKMSHTFTCITRNTIFLKIFSEKYH